MKVNFTNNTQAPAFNGAIFVDLATLDKKRAMPIIADFKRELGQGLMNKTFQIGRKKYNQDVFVGYNRAVSFNANDYPYGVLVATGDDLGWGSNVFAKIAAIDNPINATINKILKKYNVLNNPTVGVVKSSPNDISGFIRKDKTGFLDVFMSPDLVNKMDINCLERTGYSYYENSEFDNMNLLQSYFKKRNGVYKYIGISVL